MRMFSLVAILCLGAVSAISASISNEQDGLESLPQEELHQICSHSPAVGQFRFSLASPNFSKFLDLNPADILYTQLLDKFGEKECLGAALHIEGAPEVISEVVQKLLLSAEIDDSTVVKALEHAYYIGNCDLVDVLSRHLQNSSSDSPNAIFDHDFYDVTELASRTLRELLEMHNLPRATFLQVIATKYRASACDDVTLLATRPLGEVLRMHALPRATFVQVIAAKYRDSGYGSFFDHEAWYSLQTHISNSILSHVLHLYETLPDAIEFKPISLPRTRSTQNMSSETQENLASTASSRCTFCLVFFSRPQFVLAPGSEMEFFKSASTATKTAFLVEAAWTGHLDWVKFMVNHDLWNGVTLSLRDFMDISRKWQFRFQGAYFTSFGVMRIADVLEAGDPVLAAFEMIFHHQMQRLPSKTSRALCNQLLKPSHCGPLALEAREIIRDYVRHRDNAGDYQLSPKP